MQTLDSINNKILQQFFVKLIITNQFLLTFVENFKFHEFFEYINFYTNHFLPKFHSIIKLDFKKSYVSQEISIIKKSSNFFLNSMFPQIIGFQTMVIKFL